MDMDTQTLQDFFITSGDDDLLRITKARSLQHAADIEARRRCGRRATAMRTTGDDGKTGYFQAYLPLRDGGLTSCREPYHVG